MRAMIIMGVLTASTLALTACGSRQSDPAPASATPTTGSLQPANGAPPPQGALQAATGPAGYSCSFPGGDGRTILARFMLDGANARDDEGTAFRVLADSPTAVVLARPRDDVSATGDIGAYVVAIDKRDLSMVQSTVGVRGAVASRKGRCIAG